MRKASSHVDTRCSSVGHLGVLKGPVGEQEGDSRQLFTLELKRGMRMLEIAQSNHKLLETSD